MKVTSYKLVNFDQSSIEAVCFPTVGVCVCICVCVCACMRACVCVCVGGGRCTDRSQRAKSGALKQSCLHLLVTLTEL